MARRKTPAKKTVLNILKKSDGALNHKMLRDELEQDVDRTTIYRILNQFHEDGIIHKVVCDNGKQYFAYSRSHGVNGKSNNHFHFRCRKCGKVECLSEEIEVDLPQGYKPKAFNGVVSGYCRDCKYNK